MSDTQTERGRVTPLELFFDLVFVFAITQVTAFLSHEPTWGGLLHGTFLLGALWWAWSAYAWLTNLLDPEEGAVRLLVFAAAGAMLIVSLATPRAFGADAVTFAVAYLVVRLLHLVLFGIASRGDRDLFRAVARTLPGSLLSPILLLAAGLLDGTGQLALWGAAVAILYIAPLIGRMRGFRVFPEHFVERYGLIIIIALGESIVAIGVGAKGTHLDAGVIAAALLGLTIAACVWWSYFDWLVYVGYATLLEATGNDRVLLARDGYAYLHLPMLGGIVLFAFGLKTTIGQVGNPLAILPAVGLCGGIALYLAAHVALRLRVHGGWGRGRPIASLVLLALIPVVTQLPSLAALAMVAVVCVALIAYEALWHRESRAWIRSHRDGFTMDEARTATTQDRAAVRRRRRG
jgi:low temperature requirement protein LtrA